MEWKSEAKLDQEKMLNRWTVINVLISITMFIYIFHSYAGVSGGDIAIISANILFGLFQILIVATITNRYFGKINNAIILAIIIMQVIELIIFLKWGYSINEFLKKQ